MAGVTAPVVVLVNPQSRGGTTGRRLPELRRLLDLHVSDYALESTTSSEHTRRFAAEQAAAGARTLVVAGGDGTAQDVVAGVLNAKAGDRTEIGILPMGTGCDLARALGLPRQLESAVALLRAGRSRRVDVGRFECQGVRGRTSGYVVNIASWGLSGWAVRQLQGRGDRRHASYLRAAVTGIFRVRPQSVRVAVDGVVVHAGPLTLATAANGSSFGGGMSIAPDARTDDGQFDVVIAPGMGRLALLGMILRLRRKTHLGRRGVHCVRGRRIEAEGPASVWVEVDGESAGTLPLTVEVLPGAITVTGLSPA